MITLIGTGHVFDLRDAINHIFDEKQPQIIAVELDEQRCKALVAKHNNPDGPKTTPKNVPAIYKLLAKFQDNLASEYGVQAGSEMLAAIIYAQNHQLPISFIDMNAQQLFNNMWKSMSRREKLRLTFSGIAGLFISKKRVEKELKNLEGNFETYLEQIGDKFPTIKKTLIDDRNIHMANKLKELNEEFQNIIVCMGDGHVPGISKILEENKIEYEIIRLQELRNYVPPEKDEDASSAHFSISHHNNGPVA